MKNWRHTQTKSFSANLCFTPLFCVWSFSRRYRKLSRYISTFAQLPIQIRQQRTQQRVNILNNNIKKATTQVDVKRYFSFWILSNIDLEHGHQLVNNYLLRYYPGLEHCFCIWRSLRQVISSSSSTSGLWLLWHLSIDEATQEACSSLLYGLTGHVIFVSVQMLLNKSNRYDWEASCG